MGSSWPDYMNVAEGLCKQTQGVGVRSRGMCALLCKVRMLKVSCKLNHPNCVPCTHLMLGKCTNSACDLYLQPDTYVRLLEWKLVGFFFGFVFWGSTCVGPFAS